MSARVRYVAVWVVAAVRVAKTVVGGVEVSTVWLGLDHNRGNDGPPIIFETMLFGYPSADPDDHPMRRYSTEEDAMRGHLEAVDAIREDRTLEWFS